MTMTLGVPGSQRVPAAGGACADGPRGEEGFRVKVWHQGCWVRECLLWWGIALLDPAGKMS